MAAGIPNTGKSTIINALCGGKKAVTGNKAGVTKGKQWVRLRELELLDTPGTMPPAFDNQTLAIHLAYIGSMNDANIDFGDLAFELLKELKEKMGLTILFISHDLSVVRLLSDRIAVMNDGKIVELANTKEVFDNPKEEYTKNLLNAVPRI